MPGKKLISLFAVFAALLLAVPAFAEQTPETYKEAVEPICKTNTEANEKILKGVKRLVKEGKLDAAAKKVFAAAKALKRTRERLVQVEKPPADEARLTTWLNYVKTEVQLFETLGRKLAHGERDSAQRVVVRLYVNARKANNLVFDYDFRYCKFQPAKFL
ncbi:MAG TPA: hypothetical protein VK480_02125 [Solirubrobacterales bacterium]|nr:hypothetical protein [Solirubrobacterales bacterium]